MSSTVKFTAISHKVSLVNTKKCITMYILFNKIACDQKCRNA